MPTISELPAAAKSGGTDEIPVDQGGVTRSINVGTLLAGIQPAILAPTGSLFGRTSLGDGGPEPVTPGVGLALSGTTLAANGSDHLSFPDTTMQAADSVVVNTGTGPAQMPVGLLRGLFSAGENIAIDESGTISSSVPAGPAGPAGAQGPAGANGATWYSGTADPVAAQGVIGDFYLNTASGAAFRRVDAGWSQIANLVGPQGAPGASGSPGAPGATGLNGATWFTGASPPAPAQGNPNDLYLHTASGAVFQKSASGSWSAIATIMGPQGPAGPPGAGTSISAAPAASNLGSTDVVGISQSGSDHAIPAQSFGSQLPVKATIGSGTTVISRLADRFGDMPNVIRDFGAPTDGVSDASAAINAAINAVKARGGGHVMIPNIGVPLMLASPIVAQTGVHIIGHGMPVLQLQPNANCAVIESLYFQSNIASLGTSTPSNGGVRDCSLEGLIIDGNAASQQKTANIDYQNGVSMFGSSFKLRKLQIQNVLGHGIRTGWSSGSGDGTGIRMAPTYHDVVVVGSGRHGWWNQGPHDAFACNVLLVNASQEADGGFYGLWNQTSGRYVYLHCWTNNYDPNVVNFPAYACRSDGYSEFIACHFESAKQSFLANGPYDKIITCLFYNPGRTAVDSTALLDINSYGNQFTGCYFQNSPPPAGQSGAKRYAIAFVNPNGQSNSNQISAFFRDFDALSPFDFTHDGGSNTITGNGYASSSVVGATSFNGTPAAGSSITYGQTGPTRISVQPPPISGPITGNRVALQGANAGQPVAVVASGTDANVGLSLVPKRSGSLTATIPDGTVAGGANRGLSAVDWQMLRTDASQVASASATTIGGGQGNTASAWAAVVPGGINNIADGSYSIVTGNTAHAHGRTGSRTHASGSFSTPGDCQKGDTVLHVTTTDAAALRSTADGYAPSATNTVQVQPNSAMSFRLRAIARDSAGNCAYFFSSDMLITRGTTAATTALNGGSVVLTPTRTQGTVNGWTIRVSADQTLGGLALFCTGAAGVTVHWLADIEFLEVI